MLSSLFRSARRRGARGAKPTVCESAQGSGCCRYRKQRSEGNLERPVETGSPSAPIGTPLRRRFLYLAQGIPGVSSRDSVRRRFTVELRAAYMPDVARAVSGIPRADPGGRVSPRFRHRLIRFRHFCSDSLALASLDRACRILVPTFPQRSPPRLLTAAACGGACRRSAMVKLLVQSIPNEESTNK
jgi:hypothetical protein